MKLRRIMIAAPKSGSGKTVITCALLKALKERGEQAVSYKCGPDYIDPMFHEKVIGIPSRNLDTFFTGKGQTVKLFLDSAPKEGVSVMEGAMGLFDGLGGFREEGSSYHLAKVTKTPIVFVADVRGMGIRSMIPMLAGFLSYDKDKLIKGVILNRVSEGIYQTAKSLIQEELGLPVFGFFPEIKEMDLQSRHLGLVMPNELRDIREKLREASRQLEKTVSIPGIMDIAGDAEELHAERRPAEDPGGSGGTCSICGISGPVIAVARDEAFCFYYADNLLLLKKYGAEIKYFSPLYDRGVPEDCHALLLGGGYPELHGARLSENHSMRTAIRRAAKSGMPIVAECGGFMYLHSNLVDQEGISYPMAGVLPGKCFYTGKLVRFGYIEIQEKSGAFLPEGERVKGHEFHYYDSTENGEDAIAVKPATGRSYPCIVGKGNCWMGFPHLYYPSNPEFAKAFVAKAEEYRERFWLL